MLGYSRPKSFSREIGLPSCMWSLVVIQAYLLVDQAVSVGWNLQPMFFIGEQSCTSHLHHLPSLALICIETAQWTFTGLLGMHLWSTRMRDAFEKWVGISLYRMCSNLYLGILLRELFSNSAGAAPVKPAAECSLVAWLSPLSPKLLQ